ncbi:MAG TPA: DUF4169 family protein [Rhizomicrobium sp.]|nr:DUF4169 family protein [Rhizomicrobium sp.]
MPAEIVNLNRARKAKAKAEKAKAAEQNRVLHGTPKHLKQLGKARKDKARRELDAHKKD